MDYWVFLVLCFRIQRNAWFSVVHAMRRSRCLRSRFPCRGAEADSHGLAVQQTKVIPQLQFLDKVIDGPVVRVVLVFPGRSHACCVQRQVPHYVPQLQFINKVVHTPVVAQNVVPISWQTIEIPLLPYTRWSMSYDYATCNLSSLPTILNSGQLSGPL